MEEAQETTAESEAQRRRGLRPVGQRGVIQLELLQRVPQQGVLLANDRVEASEDHRLSRTIARQRLLGRRVGTGDGIAHRHIPHILETGGDVAHLAGREPLHRHHLRAEDTDLHRLGLLAVCHQHQQLVHAYLTVHHTHVGDDALVGIVVRIEDEGPEGSLQVTRGRGDVCDNGFQDFLSASAFLGRGADHLVGGDTQQVLDRLGDVIGINVGQVNLVHHRDDAETVVQSHVQVGQRLGLDAL